MNSNRNYLLVLILVVFVQALIFWSVGDIYVTAHELDVLHALDGALRMLEGERPHLDFMTPLGVMTFAPTALMVKLGLGRGAAIAFAGIFVAVMLLPALYWGGVSRLSGRVRMIWGIALVILTTASVFGEVAGTNSFSMYYNRWSWTVAFILVTIVMLPAVNRKSVAFDGIIIGLSVAFLALIKITFFAGFFPATVLVLLIYRNWGTLLIGAGVGLAVALVVTIWAGGIDYWFAYLDDLLFVQSVDLGSRNGGWSGYFASPKGAFSVISVLVAASLLSRSGSKNLSIAVLLFAPAFVFATFHNWGVEPKYLVFIALVVWLGAKEHRMFATGLTFLLIGSLGPVILNLAGSNLRQLGLGHNRFEQVFTQETHGALMFKSERANVLLTAKAYPEEVFVIETTDGNRQVFEDCSITQGLLAQKTYFMARITALGLQDQGVMVADTFSHFWMFGDFKRLRGGAIWQYGGEYGFDDAEVLIVPDCVYALKHRNAIVATITDLGYGLSLIEDGDRGNFYRIIKR